VNIASCISELLYEHECVVIPGFGGFIVNDRPATINRITHQFSPPFRKVMFNIHLSANDGLLINHIANMDHISYVDAKQMVINFSKRCQEEIKAGNKVSFINIGTLYKNSEGHITFEQNEKINYNDDAFGLGSFYSPAIERASDEERIKGIVEPLLAGKTKPTDRKPEINRETSLKRRRRAGAVVLILFVLLLSIGGGFAIKENATNYWQNYAMLVPMFSADQTMDKPEREFYPVQKEVPLFSKSETSEQIVSEEVNGDIKEESMTSEEEISMTVDDKLAETILTEAPEKEMSKDNQRIPDIKPPKRPYLIITGSFSEESNAQKLVSILKQSGIEALIADTTKNGMFRVAYASFITIEEAKETLYTLRNEAYPDAWILKKK
jgi:nucleoid DNA-binding protein/cell division septation protein DedD